MEDWVRGKTVGRYTLIAPLASGGMAEVWLARQQGLAGFEKLVVVKRMLGELVGNEQFEAMFTAEARLAAAITHRHVVQVFELSRDDGTLFIAMEYVNGETLARVLRTAYANLKTIPPPLAVQIVAWAAEGLHAAHTLVDARGEPAGLVHRDVSPQNLIVTVDGSLKVVDFGVAKSIAEHTVSGKLKGKIRYLAPEQAKTEPVDARADVFALGVILFELLTQTRLYLKLDDVQVLTLLLKGTPLPRCRERLPSIDADLDDIVARAMAHDRERRTGSAAELQRDLEAWLRHKRLSPSSAEIAAFLNELFPQRESERRRLIDESQTPPAAPVVESNASPSLGPPAPAARAPRWPWLLGLGAIVAAMGALLMATPTAKARFRVEVTPPAMLSIDGRDIGTTPLTVEVRSGTHEVAVEAPGCLGQRREVVASNGDESFLAFQLACPVDAGAPAPLVTEVADEPSPDAGVPPGVGAEPVEGPTVDAGAAVKLRGRLDLMTTPYTEVFLGKRRLGGTPLRGVTLPVGDHELRLVNPEAGISSVIEVTIKPNQTTRETLMLR